MASAMGNCVNQIPVPEIAAVKPLRNDQFHDKICVPEKDKLGYVFCPESFGKVAENSNASPIFRPGKNH